MKQAAFFMGTVATALSMAGLAQAGTLTLSIDTGDANGTLRAAVYDSQASFDGQKLVAGTTGPANGGPATVAFNGLKAGTYGIAVYLDMNGNDELDTNLFGAPTEPYGFSMNPELGFSAPKFDAFRFDHDGNNQELIIKLIGN